MNKNKVFEEFNNVLLNDERPSKYFNKLLKETNIFSEYPFDMIGKLVKTEQNLLYHPEGNVWNHTMLNNSIMV